MVAVLVATAVSLADRQHIPLYGYLPAVTSQQRAGPYWRLETNQDGVLVVGSALAVLGRRSELVEIFPNKEM